MYILKQLNQIFVNTIINSQLGSIEGGAALSENKEKNDTSSEAKKYEEGLIATQKITGDAAKSLYNGLKNVPENEESDAEPTKKLLEMYKKRYIDSNNQLKSLNDGDKIKELKYSEEQLKTISNSEFLSLKTEERLQYVTEDNIDFENIANGSVDDITFFFDQDGNGKDDSDLYRLTTIGQVMGKEVGEVVSKGITYTRTGLDGEFFNGSNRLTIHTDTKVEIPKLRTPEDINKLEQGVSDGIEEYKELKNPDIVKEALERGIDPEFAVLAFSEKVEKMGIPLVERQVKIEQMFTDIDRIRNLYKIDYSGKSEKLPDELAIRILYQNSPNNYRELAKEYEIDDKVINNISDSGLSNVMIDFEKISGGDLSKVDFRMLKNKYPNEASIKNNNPAGLTWNNTFANTLKSNGIDFYKGTSRPSSEGGSYFGFANMEEGMNAYNLLWNIKLTKAGNKTFGDFAKNWAVDHQSYKNQFGDIWNTKLASLDDSYIDMIKSKQMRIESPGMHKELKKIGVIV